MAALTSIQQETHSMRNASIASIARFASAFVVLAAVAFAQQPPSGLQRILADQELWGDDYPAVLTRLRALQDSGERTVYIFADRAAGAAAARTQSDVQPRASRMAAKIARPAALPAPFAQLQQRATPANTAVRAEAIRLRDGDGYHLALTRASGLQLLRPGLTIDAVRAQLGAPERVTQQTIQNEGDRKPVILTLHQYAGGAIAFAESNMAEPGVVERVVLDLNAAVAATAR
jgi:hypothetical protein